MSWTNDKTGWLLALGGAVVGFAAVRFFGGQRMASNPEGLQMEIDGLTVFGRTKKLPFGVVDLYLSIPGSDTEDYIGRVQQVAGDSYRVFPPVNYKRLGVESMMLRHDIESGVSRTTMRASARYLVDAYKRHARVKQQFLDAEAWRSHYEERLTRM